MAISDRLKGAGALFGASVFYASFGLLARMLADMFGDYSQVVARMGLAFVFLLVITLTFGLLRPLSKAHALRAIILGAVSACIVVFFTISVTEIKLATAIFLLYAASMTSSLLFGTLFFKESLNLQKGAALVIALLGLWMFSDVLLALSFGAVAALLSGAFEGVANGIRKGLKGADRTTALLYQFFSTTVFASIAMLLVAEPIIKEISLWPVVALIVFAVFQLALNHLLLYGFQHFDVNVGTVILTLELFFAALIGFFFFQETLTAKEVIGGVLIFAASVVTAWEFKKKS